MFSAGVTVRGLEMVVNSLLQAGEKAKPFLAKELLGQLEGIGPKSCFLLCLRVDSLGLLPGPLGLARLQLLYYTASSTGETLP